MSLPLFQEAETGRVHFLLHEWMIGKEHEMKNLYIDCRSGASGDMMLGAFIDLGVSEESLRQGLSKLGLREFCLQVCKKEQKGLQATDVDVILHRKEDAWIHPYSGSWRNYGEIKEIIQNSDLPQRVKEVSRRIFDIKAKAEAKVHTVPVDQVRFHEAGAVDSIVDIVGTAICYDCLEIDRVVSCNVPTGYGTVICACGELPVPAPAVRAILEQTGIPSYTSDIEQELLTPTGASILAGIVDRFNWDGHLPAGSRIGRGTGKRDTGLPPLSLALV